MFGVTCTCSWLELFVVIWSWVKNDAAPFLGVGGLVGGYDVGSGLVHSITETLANVHDITEAHKLIRKDDEVVYGNSGFLGIEKREEIRNNEHLANIEY